MRRSKSDPSRYARNYRSISQRKMTEREGGEEDDVDEEKEMERLRNVLRHSESHLRKTGDDDDDDDDDEGGGGRDERKRRRRRREKRKGGDSGEGDPSSIDGAAAAANDGGNCGNGVEANSTGVLGSIKGGEGGGGEPLVYLPPKKKKKSKTEKSSLLPELTPEELRRAKLLRKNASRKLKQLAVRAEQRKRREELYDKLKNHAIGKEERELMTRSSTLGKKLTKRETLRKLLRKERAGLALTEEERGTLYAEREVEDGADERTFEEAVGKRPVEGAAEEDGEGGAEEGDDDELAKGGLKKSKKRRKRKKKRKKDDETAREIKEEKEREGNDDDADPERNDDGDAEPEQDAGARRASDARTTVPAKAGETGRGSDGVASVGGDNDGGGEGERSPSDMRRDGDVEADAPPPRASKPDGASEPNAAPPAATVADVAASMMASLSALKAKSDEDKGKNDEIEAKVAAREKAKRDRREAEEGRNRQKAYVPTEPAVLKTAARIGLEAKKHKGGSTMNRVYRVDRPPEVEKSRYDLPVSAMEYEIIDAVRNNDVVVLCGETGSGKSTQVPQFLYEAGFSSSPLEGGNGEGTGRKSLIGITQPRRVAAISTAKRVTYEMGRGDGHSVVDSTSSKEGGNLVGYQTRYESSGLGTSTSIKFMTDGILLREIRSDLLLRKYDAIVLDEAHERNLNTDVLLGLLSVSIPLRRKASEEEEEEGKGPSKMKPLKLIVMSATLRVEDFTENERLFPDAKPALVKVPGRTFPVTVHHSKVTELDDYETVAFRKVCKIHRKLPDGGILVFLTGKQEITRMVRRLRKALNPAPPKRKTKKGRNGGLRNARDEGPEREADEIGGSADVAGDDDLPREMDDDEIDGDLFRRRPDDVDDFDDLDSDDDEAEGAINDERPSRNDGDGDLGDGPKMAHVLPLHSMLSPAAQSEVFVPPPAGRRLVVVATNVAETSLTIPGISYVVDAGRRKRRNYHPGTGVASYDVTWISRASADQRAGRAGRTGPGHCYRLYSSSLYSRHLDPFETPEVLTRPLEDVVLSMKAMNVTDVGRFPFPTPPDEAQIGAAVELLANVSCVDVSDAEVEGGDGRITKLGAAVSKLPLGVRYGKMLLVAAQGGVLDYAIAMVAVLSENSPFVHRSDQAENGEDDHHDPEEWEGEDEDDLSSLDEVDRNAARKLENAKKKRKRWLHSGGDVLAGMLAAGAYTYVGRDAGGAAEAAACQKFCAENGLNYVVMNRIQKIRVHLAKLAHATLGKNAAGVAAKTGEVLSSMPPPNRVQENVLKQAITSGLLDHIARLSPPGSITGDRSHIPRSAYLSCNAKIKEPLYIDRNSALYTKDFRKLPQWVCFDTTVRKTRKDGSTLSSMKGVTPLDPAWLGQLSEGSRLLSLGGPVESPPPKYDANRDAMLCSVETKFGGHGWQIPPVQVEMSEAARRSSKRGSSGGVTAEDDRYRWFARFLLEGKVLPELKGLPDMLNDDPSILTRNKPASKVVLLVSALSGAGVDRALALRRHWAERDDKFLFRYLKSWTKKERVPEVKKLWMGIVKKNVRLWKER